MRIGFAQVNPTLGDFASNVDKILERIHEAKEKKCSLVVFPECAVFGYHPFDLLDYEFVVKEQTKQIRRLHAKMPKGIVVLTGAITPNPKHPGISYFNSAVMLERGQPLRVFSKTLLPTGDVFDEARYFDSSDMSKNYFKLGGKNFLVTICEDIWAWDYKSSRAHHAMNPIAKLKNKKIDLVINLSASPWYHGKLAQRDLVIKKTVQKLKAPMLYVNLVGAQDELIFDGRSLYYDRKGVKKAEGLAFEEDLNVIDISTGEAWTPAAKISEVEELRRALVLGIRDFCRKTGLTRVHLGSSGGIDSAVVACLAVEAMGPANVQTFAMPGPFSDGKSLRLAQQLAKNLGVGLKDIEINAFYDMLVKQLEKDLGLEGFSVVHENLQSRLRGLVMMAYSNHKNSMLLSTSNKSEAATGYATLYGDMCGGLAPIGDLTKDQVYKLARYYNQEREIIPQDIIDRAPSAELRPNQKDQDSLPPYEKLDAAVNRVVGDSKSPSNETEKWLMKQLLRTEFKRWQAPPILKVTGRAFGRGRRYPIALKLSVK